MADTTIGAAPAVGATFNLKLIDNGDGTYSLQAISKPVADQDPIFDTANGEKVTLVATTSAELIVVPAGCKFLRVEADYDTFLAFADGTAGDTATCVKIMGGMPAETIPVTPGETINAYSASAATVRAMPYKVR